MPTTKSILATATALGYSLSTSSTAVTALSPPQPPRLHRVHAPAVQNKAFAASLRRQRSTTVGRNYYEFRLSSRDKEGEEDGSSEPHKRKSNEPDDEDDVDTNDDDDDEDIINMNDYIDFESMDKLFDDLPEYGRIRSLESPYEDYKRIDPPSAEDMAAWTQRKTTQHKQTERKRLLRRLFPWAAPLTSLLLPKSHAPSSASSPERSSRIRDRSNLDKALRHSRFNTGIGSPKLLRGFVTTPNAARNLLLMLNVAAFLYQIVTAVQYLPGFNRILAASVAGDAYSAATLGMSDIPQWTPAEIILRALGLVGGGAGVVIASGSSMRGAAGRIVGRGPIAAHSMGPFFLDYAHQPYPLSHFQKHRYLSSGFLHGSLLHLGMNMRALLSLPSWLENGIGKGVYLSAYLMAIITGNIAHTFAAGNGRAASALCVGASGGICGLYGLMLSSLLKMGNSQAASYVVRQMLWLVLYGLLVPNVSNAGHVGGFLGGWLVGYLFGPGYEKSYSLNRAGGGVRDSADGEFRQMMGRGIYPSEERAIFPLKYLWYGIGLAALARPELRLVPIALVRGVVQPGSLSGARALLC